MYLSQKAGQQSKQIRLPYIQVWKNKLSFSSHSCSFLLIKIQPLKCAQILHVRWELLFSFLFHHLAKENCSINNHLSAPAHDNILLIRTTWNGCKRIRMWKASFPQYFTMYLLAQMRPASRASAESCSNSSDTRCTHMGNSSTRALLRPRSKIRILGSVEKELLKKNKSINLFEFVWSCKQYKVYIKNCNILSVICYTYM